MVIMANSNYLLPGSDHIDTDEHRSDLPRSGGFTLVEIIIVVAVILIAAMLALPMFSSAGDMQVRSAANMIMADLEYAKSMAIARGQNYSVVFDTSNESYKIVDNNGATIAHPVKKGFNYVVSFSTDGRLNKVDVTMVDFDPGSSGTITFDYLGSPYSGTGTTSPLSSAQIILQADGTSMTIQVEPITGYVSIL